MVNVDPLEELVGFLHDKNPQVRAVAAQELVPYSHTQRNVKTSIFKANGMRAVTDLKILVLDEPKTAHDALTILINLSPDPLIRTTLLDEVFLNMILSIILHKDHGLADLACMLLSNLAKSDGIEKLLTLRRTPHASAHPIPNTTSNAGAVTNAGGDAGPADASVVHPDTESHSQSAAPHVSDRVMDQLLDVYVCGHSRSVNPHANYDFLTNLFSDLTRFPTARTYFLTPQPYDGVVPLSKVLVFTECESQVRRTGVASVLKNCCFDTHRHAELMDEDGLNVVLYIQSPLCGPSLEEADNDDNRDKGESGATHASPSARAETGGIKEHEMDEMFESLQFLPPTKTREPDLFTMTILLDALLLLCTTRPGRDHLRRRQTYPIIRELHLLYAHNEEIDECCEKLVNMLMRDEEGEETTRPASDAIRAAALPGPNQSNDDDDDDDDDQITEV